MSEPQAAEGLYRDAIDRVGRTRMRPELARAHLVYGEWLRRENRRLDARTQLRAAHEMLDAIGMEAFAERARRELSATGETIRKRTVLGPSALTAQRPTSPGWHRTAYQPRDRRAAVHQRAHGRVIISFGILLGGNASMTHSVHQAATCAVARQAVDDIG